MWNRILDYVTRTKCEMFSVLFYIFRRLRGNWLSYIIISACFRNESTRVQHPDKNKLKFIVILTQLFFCVFFSSSLFSSTQIILEFVLQSVWISNNSHNEYCRISFDIQCHFEAKKFANKTLVNFSLFHISSIFIDFSVENNSLEF